SPAPDPCAHASGHTAIRQPAQFTHQTLRDDYSHNDEEEFLIAKTLIDFPLNRLAGAVVGFLNPCLGGKPSVIGAAERTKASRIKYGRCIKGLPVSCNAGRYRAPRCRTSDHHNTHDDFPNFLVSG